MAALLLLAAAIGSPQNLPVLFDLEHGEPLANATSVAEPSSRVLRSRLVRFDPGRLDDLPFGQPELLLNLFEDIPVTAVLQERRSGDLGFTTWSGEISGTPRSIVTLAWKGTTLSAFVMGGGRTFRVRHVRGDLHAIDELDDSRVPLEPAPGWSPWLAPPDDSDAAATAPPRVDVLMIYTPLVRQVNGLSRVEADAAAAISIMNRSLSNSGVQGRVRLVRLAEATGFEEGDEGARFDAFANQLRDATGADLVTLIVQNYGYCGTANIGPHDTAAFKSKIQFECLNDIAFAHEAGHNFGAHHAPDDPLGGIPAWKPYGYGYKDKFATPFPVSTIMAYASCYRVDECYLPIPFYSNPDATYNGRAVGAAMQNNARLLNEAFPIVERFRNEVATSPPSAPLNLVAAVDGMSVTLTWDAPASGPVTQYFLEAGRAPAASDVFAASIGLVTSITAAASPGVYYARVKAGNALGIGPVSNEVTITIGGATQIPSAPRNLTASASGNTVSLQWDAPLSGSVAGYRLEVGSAPGLSDIFAGLLGSARTISGTLAAGTYYVRVKAVNSGGTGPPSQEVTVVVSGGCTMPSAPVLTGSRNGNTITIAWTPAVGGAITGYVVQAGSHAGGSDVYEGLVGSANTLSAAAPSGTFYIRVSAVSACGRGPSSNEVIVSVP